MTSQRHFVQPPRIASWFVSLFTPDDEAELILGDLLEEFSHIEAKSGVAIARSWYWRQSERTIAHLFGGAFRAAPWSTTAAVAGGFLLYRFTGGLPDKLLSTATDRYLTYWSAHFNAYLWVLKGMSIAHHLASMFVGCVVALAAEGRELAATMTLSIVLAAMTVAGFLVIVTQAGDASFLWILPLSFADSFAIIVGGAIVRMRRGVATTLPSGT
jgi:hypothetical protein